MNIIFLVKKSLNGQMFNKPMFNECLFMEWRIIMATTGLVLTVIVMAVAVAFTYIIQYKSVISPCFVEFDDRRKKELRLMKVYNKIMESFFKVYITLIVMAVIFSYMTGNIIFALAGMYIQIIYFSISMIVMMGMYCRSRLYWRRYA